MIKDPVSIYLSFSNRIFKIHGHFKNLDRLALHSVVEFTIDN